MKRDMITDLDDRQYMHALDYELHYYTDSKPGEKSGLHSHPFYEFYFFTEGHVTAVLGEDEVELAAGDIIIVPPNLPHGMFVDDYTIPYRRFELWISVPYFSRLNSLSHDYSYAAEQSRVEGRHIIHNDRIVFNSILSRLYYIIEEEKGDRFGRDCQLGICISELILYISRLAHEQFTHRRISQDALYQNICEFIERNISEDLSLDNIASHFDMSKYYISHVFKDNIGISLHKYIATKRLKLCHDAILSGETISHVYNTYGYEDYSSFYRAFKKEYGISPADLAKKIRTDE